MLSPGADGFGYQLEPSLLLGGLEQMAELPLFAAGAVPPPSLDSQGLHTTLVRSLAGSMQRSLSLQSSTSVVSPGALPNSWESPLVSLWMDDPVTAWAVSQAVGATSHPLGSAALPGLQLASSGFGAGLLDVQHLGTHGLGASAFGAAGSLSPPPQLGTAWAPGPARAALGEAAMPPAGGWHGGRTNAQVAAGATADDVLCALRSLAAELSPMATPDSASSAPRGSLSGAGGLTSWCYPKLEAGAFEA